MALINFMGVISTVILILIAFLVGYYLGKFQLLDSDAKKELKKEMDAWDGKPK